MTGSSLAARSPRTEEEEILCQLFAGVLGVPTVNIDDDFFALGGHSLLAARLISRIRRFLRRELSIRDVLEHRTVARVAELLTRADRGHPELQPYSGHGPVPLSPAQRRLWFINRMSGATDAYLVPLALRMRGPLDDPALSAALTDLVARHAVLRTTFPVRDGMAQQLVGPPAPVELLVEPVDSEDELAGLTVQSVTRTWDLATTAPFEARLLRLTATDHLLLLVFHHIAVDGWSMPVLMRDLATAYRARVDGAAPDWPPLPVQYADYALWHHQLLGSTDDPDSVANRQLAFWREQLAHLPQAIPLPADRPRTERPSQQAGQHRFHLDADLHRRLTDLAKARQVTLFMVLQAALAVTLTRLGAGSDIPIGAPVAGRSDESLNDLVGFFVNTVVLRTDTSGDPTFAELLNRVREADLASYANQDVPFERLVEELRPARTLGRHPLFQVMLTLQGGPPPTPALPGVEVSHVPLPITATEFDLAFEFTPTAAGGSAGLEAGLTYNRQLFDPPSAAHLAQRLLRVLAAVAAEPEQLISRIDILSAKERRQVLHDWNDTETTIPATTLPALFSAQAARTPHQVALIFGGDRLTYRELDERVRRLAQALLTRGAGTGRVVAVALPRSIDLVVALHAVHRTGAAYLPVDPDQPSERTSMMLADAKPTLVLTVEELHRIAAHPEPAHTPFPLVTPDDAAYVIYTSGSTGRPKGVVVPHRGIVNRLLWMQARFVLTANDRVLQKTPATFDVSVWEFFWPLMAGAALVVAEPDAHRDPDRLSDLIIRHRVTVIHFVPSMLAAFLSSPASAGCTSLRDVICSGEALPTELARRWAARSGARLHNLYGPTEASVDVTSHQFRPEDQGATVPIGRPVWNTRVYVLDEHRCPVPVNVPGELYLSGVQLATGYLNRPDLTAERFAPLEVGPPGERAYRTGDIVRWRADGALEYLGRTDDQVKIRGMRIEPGEIDAHLLDHPDVAGAVTMAREDRPGDQRLVSYVVPAGRTALDGQALRRQLAGQLPEHMVPAAVISMAALPRTASGKVDRRALPAPDRAARVDGRPPRNAREEQLCAAFATVLGVPEVSIDDNFFDLGGHSLLAARLTELLRRDAGIELGIAALFRTPTVAGITDRADTTVTDPHATLLPLRHEGSRPPLFCFHPAAGVASVYAGLLRFVERDRPVYGLQSPGLDSRDTAHRSFDEMVDDYLTHVRAVQSSGPYHLLGWSFGALLAHAVATRLQAQGERVDLLVMLDGYPQSGGAADGDGDAPSDLLAELLCSLRGDAEGGPTGQDEAIRAALDVTDGQLPGMSPTLSDAVLRAFRNNNRLMSEFQPARFEGDMLFFVAVSDKSRDSPSPKDWAPWISGDITVVEIACAHGDMMRPRAVSEIGPVVGQVLRRCHGEPRRHRGDDEPGTV